MGDFVLHMPDVSPIVKALRDLSAEVAEQALASAVRAEVAAWRDRAAELAPMAPEPYTTKRFGRTFKAMPGGLRKSIRVVKLKGEGLRSKTDVRYGIRVLKRAYYWQFVEFGTRNVAKRQFLRPTFDELAPQSFPKVSNKAAKYIENYFRRKLGQKLKLVRV